jgi:dTDP-glucose 4,6-dehydratase
MKKPISKQIDLILLITGGAGFIGSNFICYILENCQDYTIINLDKLTYAGELSNLDRVKNHPNYTFIEGDICDTDLVKSLFETYNFSGVIHRAT